MPVVTKVPPTETAEVRMLRCPRCSQREGRDMMYPETDFHVHTGRASGRQAYCIRCAKEASKDRHRDKTPNAKEASTNQQTEFVVAEEQPAAIALSAPEPVISMAEATRIETRQVTMVPAFARAGNMILNLSNIAFLDDTNSNAIEVVLNIHDIGKDGVQHPRTFVVHDQDAYTLRTAIQAVMGNDDQIQQIARLIKRIEDAAKNEATALELASAAERQAGASKLSLKEKDDELRRLQAQLADAVREKEKAEEKAQEAYSKLALINNALGR